MHYSSNNGVNWQKLGGGIYNNDIRAVAVSGNYVYAGTYGAGLYYSTNNGQSWDNPDIGQVAFDCNFIT